MIANARNAAPPSLLASISCWARTIVVSLGARCRDRRRARARLRARVVLLVPVQTEQRQAEQQQRHEPVLEDDRLAQRAEVVARGSTNCLSFSGSHVGVGRSACFVSRRAELHRRVLRVVPEEVLGAAAVL